MKARVRGLDAMADWCGSHGREIPRQPETLAAGMVLTRSATHAGRFSQRRAGVNPIKLARVETEPQPDAGG